MLQVLNVRQGNTTWWIQASSNVCFTRRAVFPCWPGAYQPHLNESMLAGRCDCGLDSVLKALFDVWVLMQRNGSGVDKPNN